MQWCCLSHTQWRWARSHVCCERRISQSPITPTRGSAVPSPASQNPWELILLTLDCAIFSRNAHDRSPDVSLWLSLSWWHLLCHPGVQEGLSPVLSSPTLVMLHIWPRRLQLEITQPRRVNPGRCICCNSEMLLQDKEILQHTCRSWIYCLKLKQQQQKNPLRFMAPSEWPGVKSTLWPGMTQALNSHATGTSSWMEFFGNNECWD